MIAGQSKTVRRPQAKLQKIAKEHNLSVSETKALVHAYRAEPMPTQFGIAQAFTRMAQRLTLDARDKIEQIGGNLLTEEGWAVS